MDDAEILRRAIEEDINQNRSFGVLVAEVKRLRASLAAVLRHNIHGDDAHGYYVLGVWFKVDPFPTRAEAESAYLDFAARRYPDPREGKADG